MNPRPLLLLSVHAMSQFTFVLKQFLGQFTVDQRVRVLVYHQVCLARPPQTSSVAAWCVSRDSFAEQMDCLANGGYHVFSISEVGDALQTGRPLPPKSVAITFDDGYRNNFTFAFPELVRHGFKATFYLTTAFIGDDSRFPWIRPLIPGEDDAFSKPLNWEEVKTMSDQGMTFGSHSHTHRNLANCSCEQMKSEVAESIGVLRQRRLATSNSFAAPFGVWGRSARSLGKVLSEEGVSLAFLGRFGAGKLGTKPLDLPRIIIYGDDGLDVFMKKIDGAYDWLGAVHKLYHTLRGLIKR